MSDSQGRFLGRGKRDARIATQQGQRTTNTVMSSLQQVRETQNPLSFNNCFPNPDDGEMAQAPPVSQDGQEDQFLDDASYASEVTMVTSNKSKADSSTSSLAKETPESRLVASFQQATKILTNIIHRRRAWDKNTAAFPLRQHDEKILKLLEEA